MDKRTTIEQQDVDWTNGVGARGISCAVRDLLQGRVHRVELVVADHPCLGGAMLARYEIGMTQLHGKPCIRWCGEKGDPMGAGSHSVTEAGNLDAGELCAAIAMRLQAELEPGPSGRGIYRRHSADALNLQF